MTSQLSSIDNIKRRTFYIQTLANSGTAFLIDQTNYQYLITAKHVVADLMKGESIRVHSERGLEIVLPSEIGLGQGDPEQGGVDVAVLQLSQLLVPLSISPLTASPDQLYIPQFVAMPTAELYDPGGTPKILTRTGSIAGFFEPEQRNSLSGDFMVEIEAYPGFSGSPIVTWDADNSPRIAGIAARYSWRRNPVGPDRVHSGFIGCFHINRAEALMRSMNEITQS